MVVQKTINTLKDRPKDERKAVAGGTAILIILVLLIGWAILFFKSIQRGSGDINFDNSIPQEFNLSALDEARQAIEAVRSGEDLSGLRDAAAGAKVQGSDQIYLEEIDGSTDQFSPQ
jgi:hypothetical protein